MQMQIWSDMNWRLILTLIVVSGVLAYLGDVLGMKIGKKRISLFGLRPRDTSRVITAFTGVLISIAILITMSVISENVRTALFSMKFLSSQLQTLTLDLRKSRSEAELSAINLLASENKLKEQQEMLVSVQKELEATRPLIEETEKNLQNLRQEKIQLEREKEALDESVSDLKEEAESLRKSMISIRSGRIAVFAREVLGQKPIEPLSSRSEVERIFQDLRREAEFVVSSRTGLPSSELVLAVDIEKEMESIEAVSNNPGRKFVRAVAEGNAIYGEDIRLIYEVYDSDLVYRKGDLLYRQRVEPDPDGARTESDLHILLRMVNQKAVRDSIKPDPMTGKVGILDATAFFDAVEKIQKAEEPLMVEVAAAEDIYTEGPVRIALSLSPAVD